MKGASREEFDRWLSSMRDMAGRLHAMLCNGPVHGDLVVIMDDAEHMSEDLHQASEGDWAHEWDAYLRYASDALFAVSRSAKRAIRAKMDGEKEDPEWAAKMVRGLEDAYIQTTRAIRLMLAWKIEQGW